MQALITRADERGEFDEIGMRNRFIILHAGTGKRVVRRAREYAGGRAFRIEWYSELRPYGNPLRIEFYN